MTHPIANPKPIGTMASVALMGPEFTFVSDSQEVSAVYQSIGITPEYDSLFVEVHEGEYGAIYGMCGIVPYRSKLVRRIY